HVTGVQTCALPICLRRCGTGSRTHKIKKDPAAMRWAEKKVCRQRATLPPGRPGSTIAAGGLNCRVRNGNGWVPSAIVTDKLTRTKPFPARCLGHPHNCTVYG